MHFVKYHGLGNDYLVVDRATLGGDLAPATARWLCDRHLGAGSDGVLVIDARGAVPRLRIFNPDGSEAEKSGNGLRIAARWLWDAGRVGSAPFAVETAGGTVTCRVHDGGATVTVDMGRVTFDSAAIPVTGPPREVLRERVRVGDGEVEVSAASIGNPHCVVFRDRVTAADARALGPLLERHPMFPRRTNVQLVQVEARDALRLEIWERGAGYTLASGSSSCAAAAVARRLGLVEPRLSVHMPGGTLAVEIAPDWQVRQTGPVCRVYRGWTGAAAPRDLPARDE